MYNVFEMIKNTVFSSKSSSLNYGDILAGKKGYSIKSDLTYEEQEILEEIENFDRNRLLNSCSSAPDVPLFNDTVDNGIVGDFQQIC